jgi:hypothetical protein
MSTEPLIVFVNGKSVSVPQGSNVLDAVAASDPAAATEVRNGTRGVVDSRGLPVATSLPLTGGFVMRLVSARSSRESTDA